MTWAEAIIVRLWRAELPLTLHLLPSNNKMTIARYFVYKENQFYYWRGEYYKVEPEDTPNTKIEDGETIVELRNRLDYQLKEEAVAKRKRNLENDVTTDLFNDD